MLNFLMLSLYILLNTYLIWRIGMWIDFAFSFHIKINLVLKWSAAIACVFASSTLLAWKLFPQGALAVLLLRTGNYWLGFFIEMSACLMVSDMVLLLIWLIKKKRRHEFHPGFHKIYGGIVLGMALFLTLSGCISARRIHVNSVDVTLEKKQAAVEELKVALLADTHLGYSIGCRQIEQMVEKTNALEPDLILIAGDIFDNNYDALDDPARLAELLGRLEAKYGVYAVYGNHDVTADLVGGFTVGGTRLRDPRMDQFMKDSHITVLLDETVSLAEDSIYLVGRLDGVHTGTKEERKNLEELTRDLDSEKTLFVMNHEPVKMEMYDEKGVDVLFSGHTHDGQFFPLTFMNTVAWENSRGCRKIGDMYSVVTSGIGVYGPFLRTFTEAEVLEVNIHFQ